jgi:hypothetical protein
MKKKQEQRVDPITGYPTLPWYGAVIGGFGVYTILVGLAFALPSPSLELAPPLLAIGLVGSINFVWLRTKPNLFSKFILQITVSGVFAIISYRALQYLLPEYAQIFAMVVAVSVIFVHTLPMWNSHIPKFIRNSIGLTGNKTKSQRLIFKYSIYLFPLALILGFAIDVLFWEVAGRDVGMFPLLAILGWLVAIIVPFSDQHPGSPWEKQDADSNND